MNGSAVCDPAKEVFEMRFIPAMFLVLPFLLGAGRVETRDGKAIEGVISFEENAVLVHGNAEARVAWDAITRLSTNAVPVEQMVTAPQGASLPDGWKSHDIGKVKIPGSATCDAKGAFTINASGWGAWGASDSFHFAYQPLDGDGQIIAHVGKLDQSNGPVVAGVMMRQSPAVDSPMAGACLYPSGEVRMPRRPVSGAAPFKSAEEQNPQSWVRLTRKGETLSAFRSTDGKFWQLVDSRKIPMEQKVLAGIAAWTTGNAWLGGAQIDSVRVVPGTPGLSYFPGGDPLSQGIMLRDGNIIACQIVSLDEKGLHYERGDKSQTLPLDRVARLIFSPVPPDFATPADKTGVLLASGDFVDGDITGVSVQPVEWPRKPQLKVGVRSVLFGPRSFETSREVIAVDFAPLTPAPAAYEVRTADGSLIRAKTVSVVKDAIVVDGTKTPEVVQVRKL
jgi:hypothetical protein